MAIPPDVRAGVGLIQLRWGCHDLRSGRAVAVSGRSMRSAARPVRRGPTPSTRRRPRPGPRGGRPRNRVRLERESTGGTRCSRVLGEDRDAAIAG
ncbi:Uncharacterised protein [Amycolatopsis camponoti]|uniref:Uncharacterized protein n=1 Tax=Amycolatopsis camponoti TaxID=2606593 RepID=A0A6I8M1V6_9PSEU|nr:Uncharacterised protein [Amycolatopsis camponoti]